MRIFDYKRQRPLALLPDHNGEVGVVHYASDNTLFSGGGDTRIMAWEIYKFGNRYRSLLHTILIRCTILDSTNHGDKEETQRRGGGVEQDHRLRL